MGCCFLDLFNTARSIFVQFPSSFFSIRLVSVHVEHSCSRIDTTAAWKKLRFILSNWSDFHMIDYRSTAIHAFASHILMSFSVDETLFLRYVNLSTNFRKNVYILTHIYKSLSYICIKYMYIYIKLSFSLSLYIYIYIYREREMYTNIYMNTSVSDSLKCKQTGVNTYTLNFRACAGPAAVCYRSDLKLGWLRSQLEEFRVSSHTEEL